jgi:protein-S-isoprenylcysteine O-methyltransferase Ste14
VVAFFIILIVLFLKARAEEKMLTEQLGESYREYKSRTGMLVPRVG